MRDELKKAFDEGRDAVRQKPRHSPVNPYLDIEPLRQELVDAWDEGADSAGINDIYHNGVLKKSER